MRIFKTQVSCPNCGNLAEKYLRRYFYLTPYEGNFIVVSDKSYIVSFKCQDTDEIIERTQYDLSLWDEESYEMSCGYFCSSGCAQRFANAAVDAGFSFTG